MNNYSTFLEVEYVTPLIQSLYPTTTTGTATTDAITTGAVTTDAVTTGAVTTGAVTTGAVTTGAIATGVWLILRVFICIKCSINIWLVDIFMFVILFVYMFIINIKKS